MDEHQPAITQPAPMANQPKVRLHDHFGERLQCEVPLASYTSLKIGGPAQFLIEAQSTDDLIHAYRIARTEGLLFYFLGGCSNVLIADEGLRGLVLINKTSQTQWHDDRTVTVSGGYNLDRFVEEVSLRGWADLSFAAGIPGSLGGALVGGAGAFGNLVHEYLIEALVLRKDGAVETLPVEALGITYRSSEAKKRGDVILEALMGPFGEGAPGPLMQEIARIKQQREMKHPGPSLPSAGSFFKNLPPNEPDGRRIPAGKLLDEVNAKSLRVGDAGVFEKHANIIVNHGHATAAQVNLLAELMAQRVKEKFGIMLEREVQYLR